MSTQEDINPTGKPLDLEDASYCSVALSTDTMDIEIEGRFRQRERKLYVLLIHSVWDEIGTKRQHTVRVDKIKQVFREVAGVKGFNNWIWEYLENLADIKITYRTANLHGITRLFSDVYFDEDKENVTFEIPQKIEESIKNPTRFARLNTYFLIGLKGKYSVSLYQLLESKINMNKFKPDKTPNEAERFIEIELCDLRRWLNISHGQYKQWIHFKDRVLQPAVEEINFNPLATTFTVRTEEVRGARRKVKAIKFFLKKTQERISLESKLHTNRKSKEASATSRLVPPFSGTRVYDEAKKYAKGLDVHELEREWREYAKLQNKPVENPERAFIGFVRKKGEKQGFLGAILGRFAGNE